MNKYQFIRSMVGVLFVGEFFTGMITKSVKMIVLGHSGIEHFHKDVASAKKTAELFDAMNQRICDLEEKQKEVGEA